MPGKAGSVQESDPLEDILGAGYGQEEHFKHFGTEDLDDLDDEDLLSFDNKEEEQQPIARRPAQSGRRFKPDQKRPVAPIQEDQADCCPQSQQDTFSDLANFKQQQRRIRQTPSPKQREAMKPPTRISRTTIHTKGKGQNNKQTMMEKDQAQQPEESAQITQDPTSEESSAGSPATLANKPSSDDETVTEEETEKDTSAKTSDAIAQNKAVQPPNEAAQPPTTPAAVDPKNATVDKTNDNADNNDAQDNAKDKPKQFAIFVNAKFAEAGAGEKAKPLYALKKNEELPEEVVEFRDEIVKLFPKLDKKIQTGQLKQVRSYAMQAVKEMNCWRIESFALAHAQNTTKPTDTAQSDKMLKAALNQNAKKDKKIADLEEKIKDLEAIARATKGNVNKELAQETENYVKEMGWRTTKFLLRDGDTLRLARLVTKNLPSAQEFHGDKVQEATFMVTYKKALMKGISGKRNYLVQELKKIAFQRMDDGKKLYTYDELLKCATRNIDPEASDHLFCASA